jgi:hypothetical protein
LLCGFLRCTVNIDETPNIRQKRHIYCAANVKAHMLEEELINGLQAALAQLPNASVKDVAYDVSLSQRSRPDATVSMNLGSQDIDLIIEIAKTAYPRDVREKIWQIRHYLDDAAISGSEPIPMLIANTISKGARSLLKEANVGYYDASGSLFLPAQSMYVLVDRPVKAKARKVRDAVFKGQRAQVLHFLFKEPDDWMSVKDVASQTRISTATVSETLSELERREWVTTKGSGPTKLRRLTARRDLLDAWSQFIQTQKPPETERFYVPSSKIEEIMDRLDRACRDAKITYAVSGEAAAQAYSPYLSHISRVMCRMSSGRNRNKVLKTLEARPVSEGWNFGIYTAVRKTEIIHVEERHGLSLAPPLQVYLDLLQGGGRSKEMAQHLRETTLRD